MQDHAPQQVFVVEAPQGDNDLALRWITVEQPAVSDLVLVVAVRRFATSDPELGGT